MDLICPKCKFRGKGTLVIRDSFLLPIAGFIAGMTFSIILEPTGYSELFQSYIARKIQISGTLLLISILLLYIYYRYNRQSCPKCKYAQMIGINKLKLDNK